MIDISAMTLSASKPPLADGALSVVVTQSPIEPDVSRDCEAAASSPAIVGSIGGNGNDTGCKAGEPCGCA
jgi:hypothetical protein